MKLLGKISLQAWLKLNLKKIKFMMQTKASFKHKNCVSNSRPLELLYLNLFGHTQVDRLSGKKSTFVIMDDYSRYTWVLFLAHKNKTLKNFVLLFAKVQNLLGFHIAKLRGSHIH